MQAQRNNPSSGNIAIAGTTKICDGLRWCCAASVSVSQALIYCAKSYEACDAIWKPGFSWTAHWGLRETMRLRDRDTRGRGKMGRGRERGWGRKVEVETAGQRNRDRGIEAMGEKDRGKETEIGPDESSTEARGIEAEGDRKSVV